VAVDRRGDYKSPFGGEGTGPNPTDRAKSGTKRSLQTDGAGIPIGLTVAGANRNDFKMLEATLQSIPIKRPRPTKDARQHLCLDKGYDYRECYQLAHDYKYIPHTSRRDVEMVRPPRLPGRRKARRWVVERSHSWINRFRRMLIRWEKKIANYIGLVQFVCAIVAFRAAGVLI